MSGFQATVFRLGCAAKQMDWVVLITAVGWVGLWLLPWRPWSTRQRLEPAEPLPAQDLSQITVLIPARNEAAYLGRTLQALAGQGSAMPVIVVDDQSVDGTAQVARANFHGPLQVVSGQPLPPGWTGKVWALEQGLRCVTTPLVLLLDADIELAPGMMAALKRKLDAEQLDLVSIMATLRMKTFWEKRLLPAFVYFFKLLYPFALGNDPRRRLGVAAGGCLLVKTAMLRRVGAFGMLRDALIDDCALAQRIKDAGGRTWIGLSHGVRSHRAYVGLAGLWDMVARTAFTQLKYSVWHLVGVTVLMLWAFWAPWYGIAAGPGTVRAMGAVGLGAMMCSYVPMLRYYGLTVAWALALPVVATLYVLMTWSSAIRHWQGQRAQWKGRTYTAPKRTGPAAGHQAATPTPGQNCEGSTMAADQSAREHKGPAGCSPARSPGT